MYVEVVKSPWTSVWLFNCEFLCWKRGGGLFWYLEQVVKVIRPVLDVNKLNYEDHNFPYLKLFNPQMYQGKELNVCMWVNGSGGCCGLLCDFGCSISLPFFYVFLFSIQHSHMLKFVYRGAWLTSIHICKYSLYLISVLENLV